MRKRGDEAEDRFGAKFVADCRAVLGVGVIFFTFPMFWALFDQTVGSGWGFFMNSYSTYYLLPSQGSRFTFQAAAMNGEVSATWISSLFCQRLR